jgi:hypothetical protein
MLTEAVCAWGYIFFVAGGHDGSCEEWMFEGVGGGDTQRGIDNEELGTEIGQEDTVVRVVVELFL